jgi:hypothetical protein
MPKAKERPSPEIGSEFSKVFKGKTFKLKVVKGANGTGFQLGSKFFTSPSAAAKSITGSETNGWRFWKIG